MLSSLSRTFWSQCYAEDEVEDAYEEAEKARCLSMEEEVKAVEADKEEAHPLFDFLPTVIIHMGPLAAALHEQLVREQLDYNRKLLALKGDQ